MDFGQSRGHSNQIHEYVQNLTPTAGAMLFQLFTFTKIFYNDFRDIFRQFQNASNLLRLDALFVHSRKNYRARNIVWLLLAAFQEAVKKIFCSDSLLIQVLLYIKIFKMAR